MPSATGDDVQLDCVMELAHRRVRCVAPKLIRRRETGPPAAPDRGTSATSWRGAQRPRADRRGGWRGSARSATTTDCMTLKGASAAYEGSPARRGRSTARCGGSPALEHRPGPTWLQPRRWAQRQMNGEDRWENRRERDQAGAQRMMWSNGNTPSRPQDRERRELRRARRAAPGIEMLEATGSGERGDAAAQRGADVKGSISPPRAASRRRAAERRRGPSTYASSAETRRELRSSGLLRQCNSCLGCQVPPRHGSGGRVTGSYARAEDRGHGWTREGLIVPRSSGRSARSCPSHHELKPPVSWGVEEHVRDCSATAAPEL